MNNYVLNYKSCLHQLVLINKSMSVLQDDFKRNTADASAYCKNISELIDFLPFFPEIDILVKKEVENLLRRDKAPYKTLLDLNTKETVSSLTKIITYHSNVNKHLEQLSKKYAFIFSTDEFLNTKTFVDGVLQKVTISNLKTSESNIHSISNSLEIISKDLLPLYNDDSLIDFANIKKCLLETIRHSFLKYTLPSFDVKQLKKLLHEIIKKREHYKNTLKSIETNDVLEIVKVKSHLIEAISLNSSAIEELPKVYEIYKCHCKWLEIVLNEYRELITLQLLGKYTAIKKELIIELEDRFDNPHHFGKLNKLDLIKDINDLECEYQDFMLNYDTIDAEERLKLGENYQKLELLKNFNFDKLESNSLRDFILLLRHNNLKILSVRKDIGIMKNYISEKDLEYADIPIAKEGEGSIMTLSFIRNSKSPNKNILFTWDGENLYLNKQDNDSKSLEFIIATYKENCLWDRWNECYRWDGRDLWRGFSGEKELSIGNLEGVQLIINNRYYNYIKDNGSFIIYSEERLYESDDTNIPIEVYSFILLSTINTCAVKNFLNNEIEEINSRISLMEKRLGLDKSYSSGSYVIDYIRHIFKLNRHNPWHKFSLRSYFISSFEDENSFGFYLIDTTRIFDLHNSSDLYKRILAEYIFILLTDRILFKELTELPEIDYTIRLDNNNVLFRHYIDGVSYFIGSEYNATYLKNSISLDASRLDLINSIIKKDRSIKLSAQVLISSNSSFFIIKNISIKDVSDSFVTSIISGVVILILLFTLLYPPSFIFITEIFPLQTCGFLFSISFFLIAINYSDLKKLQNPSFYIYLFIMLSTLLMFFGSLLYNLITAF